MGRFSRNKGKRGERELAGELEKSLGVKARRGVQFQGSPDSPDVVTDIPEIHVECKRTERLRLYESLAQAASDAGEKIPLVFHRQNQQPWVVILRLSDLKPLVTTLAKTLTNDESKTDTATD